MFSVICILRDKKENLDIFLRPFVIYSLSFIIWNHMFMSHICPFTWLSVHASKLSRHDVCWICDFPLGEVHRTVENELRKKWCVIGDSIFKHSVNTYVLNTYCAPGTDGMVRAIHRLFMIKENLIKQTQTEERLGKKLSMVEKGLKSEQTTKKCSYVALRVRMIVFLRELALSVYTHTSFFFRDLLNSVVTVFILFTMDHWYALLQDTWKVPEVSRTFSSIYVILWLLLGSIIFRNIIVAMMGKHRRGETWWEGCLGRN